ncbi:MAG: response regulator transcription factor [Chitinophagaceae bacterium]
MIRVYIVNDHPLLLEGIRSMLGNQKDMEVVGYAVNAKSCLRYFIQNTADVILMDTNLPDMCGTELCAEVKSMCPAVTVLGYSAFNQGSHIKKMMEKGANGYILKNTDKNELLEAIQSVSKRKTYLSFDAGKALQQDNMNTGSPLLSRREKEILNLIAEGYTNTEFANKLFISHDTVNTHRRNLLGKLKVKNTAMLIRFAVEHKLLHNQEVIF